jgi:hypothetical protein
MQEVLGSHRKIPVNRLSGRGYPAKGADPTRFRGFAPIRSYPLEIPPGNRVY